MQPKIGIDIVNVKDFSKSVTRSGEVFLHKIFTENELINRDLIHLAGVFSLKEALVKVGIIKLGDWLSIEIKNNNLGEPIVYKDGFILKNVALSTSHSKNTAISVVMIYNDNNNDRV